ncbi:unnamed protein product [Rotaria magnacalcarata]|uniref:Uncharacterized protein n=1 Tax=Rotaria magnacalcarata TaxID=392030 RepID=A0A816VIA6_9BILA|nr:unnamed protein product [Rotaria magnacalcarata]CAF2127843.1 unnamed protein product [Rotaria magnacalcarata]CAF4040116.1 unnamed protein product [Rotaria magnacalcarata]CAF4320068.1 unnamed protein product [Rotaria magnacalcarata]
MADLRKRVYSMLGRNNNLKGSDIEKHFVQEGFKRRAIYDIIKLYEMGIPPEDLPRSGRPTSFSRKNLKRLRSATANRIGVSQRKLGKTFGVAQSTIHYNLKKIGLKYYKRQKAPKYKYHADNEYIFWSDLTSSHYANETTKWLIQHKIKFVPKQVNPPNIPKTRPIEDFWSILADKVYEAGWETKTELQLKRRIYQKIKQTDMRVVQHMMTTIRTKLRKIEDKGPFSLV